MDFKIGDKVETRLGAVGIVMKPYKINLLLSECAFKIRKNPRYFDGYVYGVNNSYVIRIIPIDINRVYANNF